MNMNIKRVFSVAVVLLSISTVAFFAYRSTSNYNSIDDEASISTPTDERNTQYFSADWPYYESVDALVNRANLIVRGTVVDSRVEPVNIMGSGGELYFLHTISTVHVLDSYMGDVMAGDEIEVMIIGGETETEVLFVSNYSYTFTRENEYVMFLYVSDYGLALLLNPFHAVYIFNPRARSTSEALVSAYDGNRITLTYEDLSNIAALGR